jgi:hypothetical protein
LAGNVGGGNFFAQPQVGRMPNPEPPGWQNLRSMLLGNLMQQYMGYGYGSRPNTGTLGFPNFNPAGSGGSAGAPGPSAAPPNAMPMPPAPMPGGGGQAPGPGSIKGGPPRYAGRRLPGRPRPPWQTQSTVPQTQPGITPAYAGRTFQPSPSGTPQFGKQPKGRTAIGTPDYGMGHNLLRMLSALRSPLGSIG